MDPNNRCEFFIFEVADECYTAPVFIHFVHDSQKCCFFCTVPIFLLWSCVVINCCYLLMESIMGKNCCYFLHEKNAS